MRWIALALTAMIIGCGSETDAEPALAGASTPIAIVQLPRPELEAEYTARGGTGAMFGVWLGEYLATPSRPMTHTKDLQSLLDGGKP